MRIAICDDEKEIRESLERNVRILCRDAEVLLFSDTAALLAFREPLDILFLDIQMKAPNGMEAARKLRQQGSRVTIIFVTGMEEYVFQAFDVKAFHYLVKPIPQIKFLTVLREALEERERITALEEKEKAGIVIKKGTQTRRVYLSEIMYLEVLNRKITLHGVRETIEFYGKLTELEKSLSHDFVRCHRAFVVNLCYVAKYDAGSITLDNGEKIFLAKQKYGEFVKRYLQWLQEVSNDGRTV